MFKYHYLPRKKRNLSLTHAFKKRTPLLGNKYLFLQGCNRLVVFKQFDIKAIR